MAMDRIVQFGTSPSRVGASNMSGITLLGEPDDPRMHISPESESPLEGEHPAEAGSPKTVAIAMIGVLFLLWLAHRNSSFLQAQVGAVNFYELLRIGLIAGLFIYLGKFLSARYPVAGVTPFFQGL